MAFSRPPLSGSADRGDHAAENIGDDDFLEIHEIQDLIGERKHDRESSDISTTVSAPWEIRISPLPVSQRHVIRPADQRTLARFSHVEAEPAVIAGVIVRDVVVARFSKIYAIGMIIRGVVSGQDFLARSVQVHVP